MPIFMCLGVSIGAGIGIILKNIGVGMCLGIGIGMSVGACLDNYSSLKKAQNGEGTEESESEAEGSGESEGENATDKQSEE